MAKKDNINLADITTDDLREKVVDKTKELQTLKFNHAVTPTEDLTIFGVMRKDIARMKTELKVRANAEKQNKA